MDYELIAEGNANAIYRRSDGVCIRVSKHDVDPDTVAEYWNSFWRPKLGEFMSEMSVIEDEKFGKTLKITEIGDVKSGRVKSAEFKPKWLLPSPNAPVNSISCRTCAVKTMRNQPSTWCSLDSAAKERLSDLAEFSMTDARSRTLFIQALEESAIIDKIRELQLTSQGTSLQDCMSLRDCTVIFEYIEQTAKTQLWIVDLDPKLGEEKMKKWEKIETQLQPYYTRKSSICRLSRDL